MDYQGITFKSNDRKAMAPKALVSEIENLQQDKKMKEGDKAVHTKESFQFKFPFKDAQAFKDVTRVIYSFIDRQTGYSSHDREKIRTFIQTFIPLCFQVDDVVPDGMAHYMDEVEEEELAEDDDDNHSTNTEESESDIGRSPRKRSMSPSRRRSGRSNRNHHEDEHTMDLLRDVLTKNQHALDGNNNRSKSPDIQDVQVKKEDGESHILSTEVISTLTEELPKSPVAAHLDQDEPMGDKLFAAAAAAIAPGVKKRVLYSFFCNTTFYCFFRLYEMLYERLVKLRELDVKMRKSPSMGKRANKAARDLGLYSSRFDGKDKTCIFYCCAM